MNICDAIYHEFIYSIDKIVGLRIEADKQTRVQRDAGLGGCGGGDKSIRFFK